jgi:hypothetical protein
MYSDDYWTNPVRCNRPLNEHEYKHQLKQKEILKNFDDTRPQSDMNVLEFNSTFVEIVDRNYPFRGIASVVSGVGLVMGIFLFSLIFYAPKIENTLNINDYLIITTLSSILFFPCLWLFLKESFAYTHYPIRLNRKNRMVYVWRKKNVLIVPWDQVHFFVRKITGRGLVQWDVRGNVLADDGVTVIDSFPLSSYESTEEWHLREHFEYFRLYMEEGPHRPWSMLLGCLPLAKRKETWFEGFERYLLLMHGVPLLQWLMIPIFAPLSLGRLFAMRTSRIPQWPRAVQAACAIAPDDPYARAPDWKSPKDAKIPLTL